VDSTTKAETTIKAETSARSPEEVIADAEALLAAENMDRALLLLEDAARLGVEPDRCDGNRWLAHMLRGDFQAAWCASDAIRSRGGPDPHRFWNGEGLRGRRVIVRSLHGFGDAVQMFRFLPRVRSQASSLIVEVPPRLVEMAPCFDGMGEVITWGEAAPSKAPLWDVQLEVMELPYLLRVSTEDLTSTRDYFHLPERTLAATDAALGPQRRPRVGLAWAAGHWNPARSIPLSLFDRFASHTEIEFWSLQGDSHRLDHASMHWRDVYECGDGIVSLAATVARMDLVITVDTLAAHLAGALGVPCWLLLQDRADWRWMSQRSDTPWYPSLQLVRQAQPGDWAGLMDTVERRVNAWLAAFGGTQS